MKPLLGALAIAALGTAFLATEQVYLSIGAYHAACAFGIWRERARVRRLLAGGWAWGWTLGHSALIVAGPLLPLAFWDPGEIRGAVAPMLLPPGDPTRWFVGFAAYSMLVHAPLEETFWRGAFSDVEAAPLRTVLTWNAIGFYLVHAVALGKALGWLGLLLALPTAAAGVIWGLVTHRTRSLRPALIGHWIADAVILGGMWLYLVAPTTG